MSQPAAAFHSTPSAQGTSRGLEHCGTQLPTGASRFGWIGMRPADDQLGSNGVIFAAASATAASTGFWPLIAACIISWMAFDISGYFEP